jgi:hypothetical protein
MPPLIGSARLAKPSVPDAACRFRGGAKPSDVDQWAWHSIRHTSNPSAEDSRVKAINGISLLVFGHFDDQRDADSEGSFDGQTSNHSCIFD